jgi:hypothetical protein
MQILFDSVRQSGILFARALKNAAQINMKERRTITFQPEPDVAPVVLAARKKGRGIASRLINQALREQLPAVIKKYEVFRGPKPASFEGAHSQPVSLAA